MNCLRWTTTLREAGGNIGVLPRSPQDRKKQGQAAGLNSLVVLALMGSTGNPLAQLGEFLGIGGEGLELLAGNVVKLPEAEHMAPEWQAAMLSLILVATLALMVSL